METDNRVISCICESLGLTLDLETGTETKLIGHLPEFDSQSILQVLLALEDEFLITVEDDEVTADIFYSVGTLCEFVRAKL